jgi:hypothetical protein
VGFGRGQCLCHAKVVVDFAVDFAVDFGVDFVCEVLWSESGGVDDGMGVVSFAPFFVPRGFRCELFLIVKHTINKSTPQIHGRHFNRSGGESGRVSGNVRVDSGRCESCAGGRKGGEREGGKGEGRGEGKGGGREGRGG